MTSQQDLDIDLDPILSTHPGFQSTNGNSTHYSPRIFSCCIGLGQQTKPLLTALRQHQTERFAVDGLFVQSGAKLSVLEAWSNGTLLQVPDFVVVAIDVTDPHALELSQLWAEMLADQHTAGKTYRVAMLIGDAPSAIMAALNHELSTNFGSVIHIQPQRRVLQHTTITRLTMGMLFLNSTLICHDMGDLQSVLRAGKRVRSAATVWNHPDREQQALERLLTQLQPQHAKGVIALFYLPWFDNTIAEYSRLTDSLRDRWPLLDEIPFFTVTYGQKIWRSGRWVLVLTVAEDE